MKRTSEQETVRQLKLVNGQLNPMGAFLKLTLWIVALIIILSGLMRLAQAFGGL